MWDVRNQLQFLDISPTCPLQELLHIGSLPPGGFCSVLAKADSSFLHPPTGLLPAERCLQPSGGHSASRASPALSAGSGFLCKRWLQGTDITSALVSVRMSPPAPWVILQERGSRVVCISDTYGCWWFPNKLSSGKPVALSLFGRNSENLFWKHCGARSLSAMTV